MFSIISKSYRSQSTAKSNETFCVSTSIADKIMNIMTTDALGTEGIDSEVVVETNKITTKSPNSNVTPLKRAKNMDVITKNMAVPFVFRFTPIVRTKFEIRESLFILTFMQCKVVGNVTALKQIFAYCIL